VQHAPDPPRTPSGGAHPIGRTAPPEEVAATVPWLARDDAGFVTGHVADGGFTARWPSPPTVRIPAACKRQNR
jgi:NAD(P)-dependent dehydrogenase (short-subunit alcohol dehydrogenase family)